MRYEERELEDQTMKRLKNGPKLPQRFWEDWGYAHYGALAKRYGNQWVVIVNRKVAAASRNVKQAEDVARAKTGELHVPVIFVERGGHVYDFCETNVAHSISYSPQPMLRPSIGRWV